MKVFKFGGASIKNAESIKQIGKIIKNQKNEKILIVISAMGKSTSFLEKHLLIQNNDYSIINSFNEHSLKICSELFKQSHEVFNKLQTILDAFKKCDKSQLTTNQYYDYTLSIGELYSSTIIHSYLQVLEVKSIWVDAREYISTNNSYTDGEVNWKKTQKQISTLKPLLKNNIVITQGFIASSNEGKTITLGKEGSDYSAAIFANNLDAKDITLWKDVDGVFNSDPKLFENAHLFEEMSYKYASEMTYYGAKIIHPKTIKPLTLKNIPLYIKNFKNPKKIGTTIKRDGKNSTIPTIIIKNNQCIITLKSLNFSFINEKNLSTVFKACSNFGIKINMMQNSAISFSIVIDYKQKIIPSFMDALRNTFEMTYNTNATLLTIINYNQQIISQYRTNKKIILEQTSRKNYRALFSEQDYE